MVIFKQSLIATCIIALSCVACVKKSVYKTELNQRTLAEEREKVLRSELTDRKTEAEKLIKTIGDLNKTIGKQEGDIAELRTRIVQLSANASQTTTSLMDEKNALDKKLKETSALLAERNAALALIEDTQKERDAILADLQAKITQQLPVTEGIKTTISGNKVVLTLSDNTLFEPAGVNISTAGRILLDSLSKVLLVQPDLETRVITYTDNQLPKGNKSLTDTWDWSLRRASTITRILIMDFGVNANQLSPVGRGEFYPVASNETPEGRQQNRRVEMVFIPK